MEKIIRNLKGQFVKGSQSKYRHIPIIGTEYNLLTVIDTETQLSNDQKVMFHVKCICGKEMFIRAYFLESGRQIGCKSCASKQAFKNTKEAGKGIGFIKTTHEGVGDISKTYFKHLKSNAKIRNKKWDEEITIQFLWDLFIKQNKKCALTGLNITMSSERKNSNCNFDLISASLDRKDSKKDYEPDNIQWVHKDINKLKWAFDQDYFIKMCKLVAENN